MGGRLLVPWLAVAAAVVLAVAAPTPAATDPFGGLPATYRIRERIVTRGRIRVPGPDRRTVERSRDVEFLTFAADGTFALGSRRRPDHSLSGTWSEGLPGV